MLLIKYFEVPDNFSMWRFLLSAPEFLYNLDLMSMHKLSLVCRAFEFLIKKSRLCLDIKLTKTSELSFGANKYLFIWYLRQGCVVNPYMPLIANNLCIERPYEPNSLYMLNQWVPYEYEEPCPSNVYYHMFQAPCPNNYQSGGNCTKLEPTIVHWRSCYNYHYHKYYKKVKHSGKEIALKCSGSF